MKVNTVMVVDDEPANLRLLEQMLRRKGHSVQSFPLGRLAFAAASKRPPDLLLLDVNMPELTGYELCGQVQIASEAILNPGYFLKRLATRPKTR